MVTAPPCPWEAWLMSCSLVQCPKTRILLSVLPFLLVWCLWCCSTEQDTPEPAAGAAHGAAPQPCVPWAVHHQHWRGSCGIWGLLKAKTFPMGLEGVSLGRG